MTKSSKTRQKKATSSSSTRHTATGKKDSNAAKRNGIEQGKKSRNMRAAAGMKVRDQETRGKMDGDMSTLYASLQSVSVPSTAGAIESRGAAEGDSLALNRATEALANIST
ncbi:hypothetical protein FRB96_008993 [Tulasnella sp. 330]|nr:hypothetical protein FRB96_008993 [Tulasnella sp. 330]KAG8883655.1 hypothetical protein FRB97_006144 [Tulasnella sp. 331]KAG8889086.1 hypothetical protein FRB98_005836 [Tulasnella sp. 332]